MRHPPARRRIAERRHRRQAFAEKTADDENVHRRRIGKRQRVCFRHRFIRKALEPTIAAGAVERMVAPHQVTESGAKLGPPVGHAGLLRLAANCGRTAWRRPAMRRRAQQHRPSHPEKS
jgi:hypothetical protein